MLIGARESAGDEWRHSSITLEPDTTAEGYRAIVIGPTDAEEIRVIAEVAEVLPGTGQG